MTDEDQEALETLDQLDELVNGLEVAVWPSIIIDPDCPSGTLLFTLSTALEMKS